MIRLQLTELSRAVISKLKSISPIGTWRHSRLDFLTGIKKVAVFQILMKMLTTLLPNFQCEMKLKNALNDAIMKKALVFLFLVIATTSNAQSLKDLLYSGKLKKDSNVVIRKGDDLSSRIDTGQKKPAEPETAKNTTAPVDSTAKNTTGPVDSTAKNLNSQADPAAVTGAVAGSTAVIATVPDKNAAAKNNNQILKEYMDSLVSTLKTDVLPSKKIKSDTYYLYVDYEIAVDGQVEVTNVVSSPENSFLQEQIKQRLVLDAPKLAPVLDSTNKPRKVKRKYNFNITKE